MTFVTVSRFLELEEKVKQMANDLQGMKNEVRNPAPERNLESSVNSIPPAPPKSSTKSHEKILSQANLFIVGDAHVRNMKETIKKELPSNWSIEESYDIKANLSFVSKKCIQQIDKCDHLILMAGSNDICSSAKRDMLTSIKKVIDKYNENSPNIHHLVIENYGYAYYNKVWENVHIACSLEYAIDLYENGKEDSTRIAVDISSEIINNKFEKVSSPVRIIQEHNTKADVHPITHSNDDVILSTDDKHNDNRNIIIKLMHLNIQSLRYKTSELEAITKSSENLDFQFDFICLTEHFLLKLEVEALLLDDYQVGSYYARGYARGGSLVLVHKKFVSTPLEEINNISVE
ncbi:hypothetical protein M8J76_012878 [Diaphorina citri]|nr:hypothetical protein M8J76_012878 [Diaphorina citri]